MHLVLGTTQMPGLQEQMVKVKVMVENIVRVTPGTMQVLSAWPQVGDSHSLEQQRKAVNLVQLSDQLQNRSQTVDRLRKHRVQRHQRDKTFSSEP